MEYAHWYKQPYTPHDYLKHVLDHHDAWRGGGRVLTLEIIVCHCLQRLVEEIEEEENEANNEENYEEDDDVDYDDYDEYYNEEK